MVGYLLSEVLVVGAYHFKCLTEDRVEWFVQSIVSAFVLSYTECSDEHDAFDRVLLFVSFDEC